MQEEKQKQFIEDIRLNERGTDREEIEELFYIMSHDLQEPLNTIISYCQLLYSNYEDISEEKKRKFIEHIYKSGTRMLWLIRDLLEFSRLETTGKNIEFVDIKNIIEEIKEDFIFAIENNNVTIIYENLPIIEGFKAKLKQIFQNLISNSIKFKREKPVIIINAKEFSDRWLFSVEDNGIGIEKQYYDKIFGIFERLYTEEEYTGTGIGLAICKKTVEIHGGRIWVKSVVGEKTIFYFTIMKNLKNENKKNN